MRKNTKLSLFTLFSLVVFSSTATAQIVIDDFTDGSAIAQFTVGATVSQTTTGAGILGSQRVDTLTVPAVPMAFMGLVGFNVNGDLSVGQGPSDEISGSLVYDALAGFDLTGGGTLNAFQLNFTSSDSSILPIVGSLTLSATSGGTTASQLVDIPPFAVLPAPAVPVVVQFADFSGLDFSSVDSVSLSFDFADNPGTDFSLASFEAVEAVPEPGSLALLSMASLVLLRRRRM